MCVFFLHKIRSLIVSRSRLRPQYLVNLTYFRAKQFLSVALFILWINDPRKHLMVIRTSRSWATDRHLPSYKPRTDKGLVVVLMNGGEQHGGHRQCRPFERQEKSSAQTVNTATSPSPPSHVSHPPVNSPYTQAPTHREPDWHGKTNGDRCWQPYRKHTEQNR